MMICVWLACFLLCCGLSNAVDVVMGKGDPLEAVKRRETSISDYSIYRSIARERKPIVLTQHLANRWNASDEWSIPFVLDTVKKVSVLQQAESPSFATFRVDKPLTDVLQYGTPEGNEYIDRHTRDIFWNDKLDEPKSILDEWLYFSTNLLEVDRTWLTAATPLAPFVVDDKIPLDADIETVLAEAERVGLQVNLWLGRAGTTTHAHYDNTYNWFMQLRGNKTFHLAPPSAKNKIYPVLHPYYCHAQPYPTDDVTDSLHDVVEVTLRPGEMLFLPPYWMHHVVSESDALSVNVWTFSPEYDILDLILQTPLPFESEWSTIQLRMASVSFLTQIISHVEPALTAREFIDRWLLEPRYNPLPAEKLRLFAAVDTMLCDDSEEERIWELTDKFSEAVEEHAQLWRMMRGEIAHRGDDIVPFLLGNYVEHFVNGVIGAKNIYAFLSKCF